MPVKRTGLSYRSQETPFCDCYDLRIRVNRSVCSRMARSVGSRSMELAP